MNDFDINKLIQLAMGGLTVNWNVLHILGDNLIEENYAKTVYIGKCMPHIVYGPLKEGTLKSLWKVNSILKFLFWLFNKSSVRRDVYTDTLQV